MRIICLLIGLGCLIAPSTALHPVNAAELIKINEDSEPAIEGKEVDWIYGDFQLVNDQISLTIANPLPTRDANLTVRDIGASILDLTLNDPSNDQLSAFIPAAGRYQFHDPSSIESGKDGDTVYWQCKSSNTIANDGTTATIRYTLSDGNPYVLATITIEGDQAGEVAAYDGVRADKTFDFEQSERTAYCSDAFFGQTIGFQCPNSSKPPSWKRDRPMELRYTDDQVIAGESSKSWSVQIYPATCKMDLFSVVKSADAPPTMCTVQVQFPKPLSGKPAFVARAMVSVQPVGDDGKANGEASEMRTDDEGVANVRLAAGEYLAKATAPGYRPHRMALEVRRGGPPQKLDLSLAGFSGFSAKVTDQSGDAIPAKATIYAADGNQPDFGPDSTRTFVKNCVYAVHGQVLCPLNPGTYDVYFSHGPEYNSYKKTIEVKKNEEVELAVTLERVVDTTGWVSTELHSHSSPSGDNTSDQYGRVENLLCEHLEFAPCTEHQRISSYVPHLDAMGLVDAMATCSGMELTGRPLPVNHQNVFPLHHHPHTQNGGGPRTDANPVVQIERIAMWDDNADKVVQMNHPNLHQIYGDLDVDGKPDSGFRTMLGFTDVIEVHPLQTIFEDVATSPPNIREMRIPLFQWMQLLNQGYRIPGVVNTDAHYNHHGSGWLRNWFASSTDDPAKISIAEMIEQAEAGHIVMSTGPFLSVKGYSKAYDKVAIPGDDLPAKNGKVTLKVTVQCPNWLDVNRVQLFINGRPSKAHNRTRKSASDQFGSIDDVVKFDSTFDVELTEDAHIIVATVGEGMTMNRVMGEQYGDIPPIAVSNPIFVDIDGDGFTHNHDELGLPLPKTDTTHSHPH